ncbi:MAG TPA: hypothetical protein DCX07_14635 [Phycisphaerales bacterium]|nr:hypothetical protein [Phycisphaerales bacterium]
MGDHADDQQLRALRQRIETLERELQSLRAGGGQPCPANGGNGDKSFFGLFPPETAVCRRAEGDLCREESTARALLNATSDRALLIDSEGILLAMNVPAARAFGATPEELIGQQAFDLMPPELARTRRHRADEVLRSGQPMRFEDQREGRTLDNYLYPVLDGAGKAVALAIYVRDVTDQHRAERMLHEANERLQYIIDNTYDVIFTMDLEGNYTFANPAAETLTGYTRDELLKMNMRELAAPEYHHMLADRAAARARGENNLPQPFYFEIIRKDGRRVPVELTSAAVLHAGHIVAIQGIARDITERRRTEKAMRNSQRQLITVRDDERQRLARELHDSVGQGLIVLQLAMNSVLEGVTDCLPLKTASQLGDAARKCTDLIREIRGICHGLFPPTLDSLGLAAALRQLLEECRPHLKTVFRCRPDLESCRLEPAVEISLFRIAQEAVTNALRHSEARKLTVEFDRADGTLRLVIIDDGVGFDSRGAVGAGLGLNSMTQRAESIGGVLSLSSRRGATRIEVTLPEPPPCRQ